MFNVSVFAVQASYRQVSSPICLVLVLCLATESGYGVTKTAMFLPLDLIIRKRNACIAGLCAH
jgi:hypothetical protein